jgi:parallel beta-helix repeat protein
MARCPERQIAKRNLLLLFLHFYFLKDINMPIRKSLLYISLASIISPLDSVQAAASNYWSTKPKVYSSAYIAQSYTCSSNYYVATTGKDSNSGSSAAPWRTVSRAIAVLSKGGPKGGVCVNVGPGTYTESLYLSQLNGSSDTATGYLVFRSSTLHGAILQLPYANVGTYKYNVTINNSHFIIFDGFEAVGYPNIPNAGEHAFYGYKSHHIKILNNIAHDVGGSGFASSYSDYLSIQGNVIYNTSCCNVYGGSAISDWQPVASDTNAGFHNVISQNIIFNNSEGADGRNPHTEGHGIILDSFRLGPSGNYPATTLIENNLIYNNGGAGIVAYYSNNATVRDNTVFANWRDPLQGAPGGELSAVNSSQIIGVNNISVCDPTTNPKIVSIWDQTWDNTNLGNVWANNLTFNGTPGQPAVSKFSPPYGTPITAANGNILGADPLFVNPAGAIFTLQSGSPAIGTGTAAYGVPTLDLAGAVRGTPPDMGAYAYTIAQ